MGFNGIPALWGGPEAEPGGHKCHYQEEGKETKRELSGEAV